MLPPEVAAHIETLCAAVFDALKKSGNDKQSLEIVLESLLSSFQKVFVANIKAFSLTDANNANIDIVLMTTLIRVALNNPMWGSEALTLQLKEECHQIVRGAGGIRLEAEGGK